MSIPRKEILPKLLSGTNIQESGYGGNHWYIKLSNGLIVQGGRFTSFDESYTVKYPNGTPTYTSKSLNHSRFQITDSVSYYKKFDKAFPQKCISFIGLTEYKDTGNSSSGGPEGVVVLEELSNDGVYIQIHRTSGSDTDYVNVHWIAIGY